MEVVIRSRSRNALSSGIWLKTIWKQWVGNRLGISTSCTWRCPRLFVIVLELAIKASVIVFKIVSPALMHVIYLTAKTGQLFIILMTMLEISVTTMTKAKTRKNESVFMGKLLLHINIWVFALNSVFDSISF